ncbi:ABC transporter substrate-binding protein [Embleya sp. NPDC005971]|uniref:ABC transporter substrate-binding protein n=1 Tax=Embleya sp. NPDC005971 TaxID=3156724 RepID=UPI0033FF3A82
MRCPPRAAATVFALGLLVAGCGGAATDSGAGGADTVTIAIPGDPGNMNPLTTLTSSAVTMNRFTYDSLIKVDPVDGRIVPSVAEKWTTDASSATFTIRRDVKCDNGVALTASDIAAQYAYIVDPANKSPLNGLMVPPGVVATADDATNTLTLKATNPSPFLVRGSAMLPLVCPTGLRASQGLDHASDGTGPYRLTEVAAGDHFTFTKRPGYAWGPDGIGNDHTPERVVFKVIGNESTRANLLLGGQLDITPVSGSDRSRLLAAGVKYQETRDPLGMLTFNEAAGRVTADPQVRLALISALNLKQIGAVATGGKGVAPLRLGVTMGPPCTEDAITGNIPPYDRARAAETLRAAGWKKVGGQWSKDGRQLSVSLVNPGNTYGTQIVAAVELMAQQWTDFGVKVSLRPTTPSTNATVLFSGAWEVAWAPFSVTTPDQAVPFLGGPPPPEGLNFGSLDNPEYKRLMALAMAKPDTSGCPEWTAAESELIKRVDVVTFMDSMTLFFTRGFTFQVDGSGPIPTTLHKVGGR